MTGIITLVALLQDFFRAGLGKFVMLVSNDLFRHDEVGLGK
jgi:hypothetical protein